jgi:hypothetical protein
MNEGTSTHNPERVEYIDTTCFEDKIVSDYAGVS